MCSWCQRGSNGFQLCPFSQSFLYCTLYLGVCVELMPVEVNVDHVYLMSLAPDLKSQISPTYFKGCPILRGGVSWHLLNALGAVEESLGEYPLTSRTQCVTMEA